MRLKYVYILLIFFLICCHQKDWQKSSKYRMTCYKNNHEHYLEILDDNNNEIISLAIDKNGNVFSLHTDYKGFYLSAGRLMNTGEFNHIVVRDENTMYNILTQLNQEEGLLIYRTEQYKSFFEEYRLYEDGKTNIKHWDYINEIWLESNP
jgi:hypothetical protein